MTIELQSLLAATLILFALLVVQGALAPLTHGWRWGLDPATMRGRPQCCRGG